MRLGRGKTILFIMILAGALPLLTADFASAQQCDFETGGGFILRDSGVHGNFGEGGGCKKGSPTWGHLEYHDHGSSLNVHGTGVTGYFFIDQTTRDISGTARTNDPSHPNANYCVEVSDNDSGGTDTFVIQLTDPDSTVPFYTTQTDADHTLHGGNITIHKHNPSTTGSFSSGSCLVSVGVCDPPLTDCNGVCTDTSSDPNNCGQCGVTCDITHEQFCLEGNCFPPA